MYIAEIQGKLSPKNENKEDILTSNVFSFFKYAPREIFLFDFMKLLGIEVTKEDATNAEFHFWPRFEDNTEPDLVILIGDYYLLIEAKYFSGFGEETDMLRHQLVREIEGGKLEARSIGKKFKILAVTADYHHINADKYKNIPGTVLKELIWINWQKIAFLIYDIIESDCSLTLETRVFANDLYALFQKKNLRSYGGINILSKVRKFVQFPENIFFEASTARYRGDFIGFQKSLLLDMKLLDTTSEIFFRPYVVLFKSLFQLKDTVMLREDILFFEGREQ